MNAKSSKKKIKLVAVLHCLPKNLIAQERSDAIRNLKSINGIAGAIYGDFFKKDEKKRDGVYVSVPNKTRGRKIK